MHLGFRRSQEPGSYLYRACTQYQRCCYPTRIGDSTRSNDRHGNRVDHLR
jgi:hypothetical protein